MKPLGLPLPATASTGLGIMLILLMVNTLSTAGPHQIVSALITFCAKALFQNRNNILQLYNITATRSLLLRWKSDSWSFLSSLKPALFRSRTKIPRLVWQLLFASVKISRVEISPRSDSIFPINCCTTNCRLPYGCWGTEKRSRWLSRAR